MNFIIKKTESIQRKSDGAVCFGCGCQNGCLRIEGVDRGSVVIMTVCAACFIYFSFKSDALKTMSAPKDVNQEAGNIIPMVRR